ncbi:hypothetical protein BT93_H1076 [Corymbia citriodora subsp. variegata]|nr:hypothetical protein BT93_H1076 [Corymbia citriodora subsp. variegata]
MDGEVVVVAVDASKEITDYAFEWAVRNLTKASDSIFLLAVLPSKARSPTGVHKKLKFKTSWFFSGFLKKWSCGYNEKISSYRMARAPNGGVETDLNLKVKGVCELMMWHVFSAHKIKQVHSTVKVITDAQPGSVATAAGELGATWVVLDTRLKKEGNDCLKHLICNVVLVDHAIPRILREVDPHIQKKVSKEMEQNPTMVADMLGLVTAYNSKGNSSPAARSSLGFGSANTKADTSSSLSNTEKDPFYLLNATSRDVTLYSSRIHLDSQYFHQETKIQAAFNPSAENTNHQLVRTVSNLNIDETLVRASVTPLEPKWKSYSGPLKTISEMAEGNNFKAANAVPVLARRSVDSSRLRPKAASPQQSKELITRKGPSTCHGNQPLAVASLSIPRTLSVRSAMSLSNKHHPTPPPLCSVCKPSASHFGKAPRKFGYKEIERATNGFAAENFLAEGGFGTVYRGVLPDGQVVAVKQHKFVSARGASEFCSEIEVLSSAQHKNLVMLVGYCIETEWLLIYEFACNGSLDKHLYGKEELSEVLSWPNRVKVAIGAARGLRYLHEDCRVGCIIHRDFRPNNILLTHDFEPMVGDFGLARWQADGQAAEETRVIGAFGYLAPEYTQTGLITEKADVYAYGIVLLELLSGIKATDFSRSTGKQFVSDWGLPLLKRGMINSIIDPQLLDKYVKWEADAMMHAAELCLSPQPEQRLRMSQVLKILDGDFPGMASASSQHISDNQSENLDSQNSSWVMHHNVNEYPSKVSELKRNGQDTTRKPALLSDGPGEETSPHATNNSERLYQAYLQGSLAKFIHNMRGN